MREFYFGEYRIVRSGPEKLELYTRQIDRLGNTHWKYVRNLDNNFTVEGRALTALFNEFALEREQKQVIHAVE